MLKAVWYFRRFLRPYWRALVGGALLVLLKTVADLAEPWPLKVIIDGAVGRRVQHGWLARAIAGVSTDPEAILVRALGAAALFVGLSSMTDFASDYLLNGAGQRMMMAIRGALFSHLQRRSLAYHDQQRIGDLVGRVTTDIERLQTMLIAMFDTLIPSGVMLVALAVVMVVVDPLFGLLALTVAPALFALTYSYTLRIKHASRWARQADAGVAALASETLGAIRAVQAFCREDHEDRRLAACNAESLSAGLVAIRLKAAFPPLVQLVSLVGTTLVIYVGVRRVLAEQMTLGLLLIFLAYLASLYKPMRALSQLAYLISQGTVAAERVREVLEVDDCIVERRRARPAHRLAGAVELRDVTFRYLATQPPVLERASLSIEPREHVGIVGRSGTGKSTLVSLIPRFYDPETGAVLVDGVDVREFQLVSLRRQVSLVLQDPILFYGSILDNIRYGNPEASMLRVWEVVEAAHVSEFLRELPDGIDTRIGERGLTLSGGQRQRITIARAMLCDAPLLILDEPTTGLDSESERLVLAGLARLSEGKTTLVISHHTAALMGVSRVLSVEDRSIRDRSAWSQSVCGPPKAGCDRPTPGPRSELKEYALR